VARNLPFQGTKYSDSWRFCTCNTNKCVALHCPRAVHIVLFIGTRLADYLHYREKANNPKSKEFFNPLLQSIKMWRFFQISEAALLNDRHASELSVRSSWIYRFASLIG